MDITTIVQSIPALAPYAGAIAGLVTVAAVLARFLPPPSDKTPTWYPPVYATVNWIAQNGGHATNASAPSVKK